MRPQQQNRRMRGRNNNNTNNNNNNNSNNNNRRGPNPLTRSYESNGPDVKIRGSAQQIAEKYLTLARDAQSAGDRVMAENYLQHAEHYNRIIAAAQAQMPQQQPFRDFRDEGDEDEEGDEFEAQPSFEQQPQQRQVTDGSGPQPVINGVPAEIALNQEAALPGGGEQPQDGRGPAQQADGDANGPRRSRRQRRRNRSDRQPGDQGPDDGGNEDDGDGRVYGAESPAADSAPETATVIVSTPAVESSEPSTQTTDQVG